MNDNTQGDVLVIRRDLKSEVKFVSAQIMKTIKKLIHINQFYPGIFVADVYSISVRLESSNIYI